MTHIIVCCMEAIHFPLHFLTTMYTTDRNAMQPNQPYCCIHTWMPGVAKTVEAFVTSVVDCVLLSSLARALCGDIHPTSEQHKIARNKYMFCWKVP